MLYFLTKKIELSATLRKRIRLGYKKQIVSWALPSMKTCARGDLTERSHKRMCHVVKEQLCPA